MRRLLYIVLPLLLLSCENDVDAPDWPDHDPKLVVTAGLRIEGDSVFVFCRVSRTVSLSESYQVENAMVNDADVRVEHDGVAWEIPFRENYYPFEYDVNYAGVVPRGTTERFVLSVKKGGLHARAMLQIPGIPLKFDSLRVTTYRPQYNEGVMYYRLTTPQRRVSYDLILEQYSDQVGWGNTWYSTRIITESYDDENEGLFQFGTTTYKRRIRYTLIASSPERIDYENSRWWSGSGDSPFEPEPNNPAFNMEGDGIGFFWWELVGDPVEIEY